MTQPAKPSTLERITANPAVEAGLTFAAAVAATTTPSTTAALLVPLVPVLVKSLAATRQQMRVETALAEMSEVLEQHADAIVQLSDAQYKLINETVISVLSCTQSSKLRFLKNVARNTISVTDLSAQEAIALSRVVRDISAEETEMLIATFRYERIRLGHQEAIVEGDSRTLRFKVNTPEAFCVAGLLSLGVLSPGEDSIGASGSFIFTAIAGKLLTLLRDA